MFLKPKSIVMYHSVGKHQFSVSINTFKQQLSYFAKLGIGSLPEYCDPSKRIFLTFDDGYIDNFEYVFPLIKEANIRITIFIPTKYIGEKFHFGRDKPYQVLSEEMIREMSRSNLVEFGSHTHTHANLTKLSLTQIDFEIGRSKEILEDIIHRALTLFAYPFSLYDTRVPDILQRYDFACALGGNRGYLRASSNKYNLPRWGIGRRTKMVSIKIKANGIFLIKDVVN